jgi:cathepsin A (carboxypeptidase C)
MGVDMSFILKAPESVGSVRLLILQGNDDYICNTPGNKLVFEDLGWSGQADYRLKKWTSLPAYIGAKGEWKGTDDGRLVFVAVEDAGHSLAQYQPAATYRILNKWVSGESVGGE